MNNNFIKVVSVSPTGRIRKTTAVKQSAHSRINELLNQLGIDREQYKFNAGIRLYSRMSNNPHLGINC